MLATHVERLSELLADLHQPLDAAAVLGDPGDLGTVECPGDAQEIPDSLSREGRPREGLF